MTDHGADQNAQAGLCCAFVIQIGIKQGFSFEGLYKPKKITYCCHINQPKKDANLNLKMNTLIIYMLSPIEFLKLAKMTRFCELLAKSFIRYCRKKSQNECAKTKTAKLISALSLHG